MDRNTNTRIIASDDVEFNNQVHINDVLVLGNEIDGYTLLKTDGSGGLVISSDGGSESSVSSPAPAPLAAINLGSDQELEPSDVSHILFDTIKFDVSMAGLADVADNRLLFNQTGYWDIKILIDVTSPDVAAQQFISYELYDSDDVLKETANIFSFAGNAVSGDIQNAVSFISSVVLGDYLKLKAYNNSATDSLFVNEPTTLSAVFIRN